MLGELEVRPSDPLGVVGHEVDHDLVVDVEPLRVMAHRLGAQRGPAHECEGADEVREGELAVELAVPQRPPRQLRQTPPDLVVVQPSRRRHDYFAALAKSARYFPYPSTSSLSTGMKRREAELMQ